MGLGQIFSKFTALFKSADKPAEGAKPTAAAAIGAQKKNREAVKLARKAARTARRNSR